MTELAPTTLKDEFAFALLVALGDAAKAAAVVCPDNAWYQTYIKDTWPTDAYVMLTVKALIAEYGEEHFLPDKYGIGQRLVVLMDKAGDVDGRLKAIELYSRIFGFIKPNGAANVTLNNNVQNNKVMIVRDHGNDDDWERKALAQQQKLQIEAA